MILKYLLYISSMLIVLAVIGLVIKPVELSGINVGEYRDPFLMIREAYAKAVWLEFEKQTETEAKFSIIQRVLNYFPEFRPANEELCANTSLYRAANISTRDLLRSLKNSADTLEELYFVECYVGVLKDMQRYMEALSFLNQKYMQEIDPSKQDQLMNMAKAVEHEKNMLDLAKAVETYFQLTRTYPGDILMLVREGLIDRIPQEPYGGQYFVSRQGQVKSTSEMMKND